MIGRNYLINITYYFLGLWEGFLPLSSLCGFSVQTYKAKTSFFQIHCHVRQNFLEGMARSSCGEGCENNLPVIMNSDVDSHGVFIGIICDFLCQVQIEIFFEIITGKQFDRRCNGGIQDVPVSSIPEEQTSVIRVFEIRCSEFLECILDVLFGQGTLLNDVHFR